MNAARHRAPPASRPAGGVRAAAMSEHASSPRARHRAGAGDVAARRRRARSTRPSPRAREALPAWRALAPGERARRCCARSPTRSTRTTRSSRVLEARNAGKAIGDARGEMAMVVDTFRYYAGAPERLLGDTIPVAGGQAFTVREPLGVVGLITPWNFPLTIASWKLAPGARRGQHRGAEARRADAADGAALRRARARGGPRAEGVVNVVVGPGPHVRPAPRRAPRRREDRLHRLDRGRALDRRGRRGDDQARDARARRQVGQHRSSPTPTSRRPRRPRRWRCSATPARTAARARGSSCRSDALDRFLELLEREVKALRVGDPLDESTQMGPLISAAPARERRLLPRGRARRWPSAAAPRRARASGLRRRCSRPSRPSDRVAQRGGLRPDRRRDPLRATRQRRSRSPTTRSTASRARSGRATARARCASRARSRRGCCRSTRTPRCA